MKNNLSMRLVLAGFMIGVFYLSVMGTSFQTLNGFQYVPTHSDVYSQGPETIWLAVSQSFSNGDIVQGWVTCAADMHVAGALVTFDLLGDMLGNIIFDNSSYCLKILNELRWRVQAVFNTDGNIYSQVGASYGTAPCVMKFCAGANFVSNLGIVQGPSNEASLVNMDGCGNKVYLSGVFTIGANATLVLKNMNLIISTSSPFVFASASSKLILQDVNIFLSPTSLAGAPVFFDNSGSRRGCLTIKGLVTMNGYGQTFDFNSDSTSNTGSSAMYIDDNATLKISSGVNFKVSANSTGATKNQRVYLNGAGSTLHLDNCTFTVPTSGSNPGLRLERGLVLFSNHVLLANSSNTEALKGLWFGDGSSSSNNAHIKLLSGAQLVVDGYLFHAPA